jgi:hypothetical protein
VPEVIEDGVTGFVVESVEEAVNAVERVAGLSRQTCHQVFENRFDVGRMSREYVEVYRRLAHAGPEQLTHPLHASESLLRSSRQNSLPGRTSFLNAG